MKNLILISAILLLGLADLTAQEAMPIGMRYQAIARDSDGAIRSNEKLDVKIELLSLGASEEVVYAEHHRARSGEFGLINITIGEGESVKGSFDEIQWGNPIWLRLSVKNENSEDFDLVTTNKLYSVPYAFYAATAGSLSEENSVEGNTGEEGNRSPGPGKNSINWTLEGNKNSEDRNDGNPVLGTTDGNDLVIVTNNTPRMIIDEDGPVQIAEDLDIDGSLNADGATTLNGSLTVTGMNATALSGTLTVDKPTTLNDALTVENMAPTELTGSLDVDKTLEVDGATTLNNALTVANMSPTLLTGSLGVGKATTLMDSLTVANMAPAHLTGPLTVDGAFLANGQIQIDGALEVAGMNPTLLTGTLDVDKLATLNAGLRVSGAGNLGPNGEHIAYFNNTAGGNGDGIGIRINTATTAQNNFVTFYKGDNSIAGRIEGYVLNDIGTPPIPTSDEIWSAVCITIADYNPVTIFWTQFAAGFNLFGTIWNGATIPSFDIPDFPGLAIPDFPGVPLPDYPGVVLPDFPGLVLPNFPGVNIPDVPSVSIDGVGEIFPGLTLPNIPSVNIPDIPNFVIPDVPSFVIPDVPSFAIPDIPAFVIPDVPAINLSQDLFTVPTIPTFSDILVDLGVCPDENIFSMPDGYVYRLVQWGVQNDMQNMISFNPVDLAAKVLTWGVTKVVKSGGVTYGSQGADYAEYLPKMHNSEKFLGGEIVGVHGGKISKVTTGADQILAISTKPLVLGNQPDESEEQNFEKVGFLGQVPVFVQGPVALGDYIVPSGKNDGIGKAIPATSLTAENLPLVFGKAWSESPYEATAVINVSIGLRPNEIAEVLKQREESLNALKAQIDQQEAVHHALRADVEVLKIHLNIGESSAENRF